MEQNPNKLNRRHLKAFSILSITLTLAFGGCKKENSAVKNDLQKDEVYIKDDRLVFTKNAFERLMKESHQKNSTATISDLISKLDGHQDFISLNQEAENISATGRLSAISLKNSLEMSVIAPRKPYPPGDPSTPIEPVLKIAELVPDPYFASVLNPEGEVEVDNTLYKVTEHGTFASTPDNYIQVNKLLNKLENGEDLTKVLLPEGENLFKIKNTNILFYDTYNKIGEPSPSPPLQISDYPVPYNPTYQYRPDADNWIYDSLPTIQYGGKTWFGKLIESIRGRDENYEENFESKRRVRVSFYNSSWLVYSSIGISVRMQKKNWIGWSGTKASELRLGWDAMEYYSGSIPSTPPAPISSTPQRFTPLDLPKITADYVEVDLCGYGFQFDKNENLQKGIKKFMTFYPVSPA